MTVAVNKASISPIRTIGGLRTGSRCPYTFDSILSDIERMFYMYYLPFSLNLALGDGIVNLAR